MKRDSAWQPDIRWSSSSISFRRRDELSIIRGVYFAERPNSSLFAKICLGRSEPQRIPNLARYCYWKLPSNARGQQTPQQQKLQFKNLWALNGALIPLTWTRYLMDVLTRNFGGESWIRDTSRERMSPCFMPRYFFFTPSKSSCILLRTMSFLLLFTRSPFPSVRSHHWLLLVQLLSFAVHRYKPRSNDTSETWETSDLKTLQCCSHWYLCSLYALSRHLSKHNYPACRDCIFQPWKRQINIARRSESSSQTSPFHSSTRDGDQQSREPVPLVIDTRIQHCY